MNLHAPVTATQDDSIAITNAHLILSDRVIEGSIVVEGGRIVEIEPGRTDRPGAVDAGGDYILPGLVDVHTDHFEKHVFPRAHVRWDPLVAALAHDAQIIGAGVTTVFDSICVGSSEGNSDRAEILGPILDAIRVGRRNDFFRADHLIHLRCEIVDPQTPDLVAGVIDHPDVRLVSVMDHTPGERQSRDVEGWVHRKMAASGASREAVLAEMRAIQERAQGIADGVRAQVIAMAAARAFPTMSHDDASVEHVAQAVSDGVTISEFPTTVEAAEAARAAKLAIVAGAPNYVRGGSQSGNIAVKTLLQLGLVDILASDYVPRSMLDAAFRIADDADLSFDLPASIAMVTSKPAAAAGLADRGELAVDKRADLLRVRRVIGHPIVVAAWREGRRVS